MAMVGLSPKEISNSMLIMLHVVAKIEKNMVSWIVQFERKDKRRFTKEIYEVDLDSNTVR
jgi:hypothetical protein